MPPFSSISIKGWRQIVDVDLHFHPRLTVLTGANGAGKTTILSLLARHFGWTSAFLSTPRYRENGILEYLSDLFESIYTRSNSGTVIGNIGYDGDLQASLMLPTQVGSSYDVIVQGQRNVQGLHIPSHKPLLAYQPLQSIPTQPPKKQNIFAQYSQLYRQRYTNAYVQQTPALLMKEALVALGNR